MKGREDVYRGDLPVIVLAGNPNVGKSTIFNCLTGMRQHTGNWAGKTVDSARGIWKFRREKPGAKVILTDAPGCYSLNTLSPEEELAKKQICDPDTAGVIIVCDALCLERNLILVLQILEERKDAVLCVNMMDQAGKRGKEINREKLEEALGIKVFLTSAGNSKKLRDTMEKAASALLNGESRAESCLRDGMSCENKAKTAASIAEEAVRETAAASDRRYRKFDVCMDKLLTWPPTAFPAMAVMFMCIFWLTLRGANYPSNLLGDFLFSLERPFYEFLLSLGLPASAAEMAAFGMYRVVAWVVSVMLPPMAIFFPLFTLLEDWGFLPRIAFDLDRCFKCCRTCGKQALTMCMGLGCNAAAVVGCRIIDSRRERLIAMITNGFIPCNGRFPILIAVITIFFTSGSVSKGAAMLTAVVIMAFGASMIATRLLSGTLLKGESSSFILELPPYRKPRIGRVIIRSVFDRTLFVLARAIAAAAPAGILIWILANTHVAGASLTDHMAEFMDPIGRLMGLDGVILTAFILGIPANETVLPIALMIYMSRGTLNEITDMAFFGELLAQNGWTSLTAVNMLVFTVMHWPCATTLLSVKKESRSLKWAAAAFLTPAAAGILICAINTFIYRFFL